MKATPIRGQGIPPNTQPPSEPEEPTQPVEEQPPAPPGPTRPLPIRTIAIAGAAVVAVVVIALLVFRGGEEEAAPPAEVIQEEVVAPPAPIEEPTPAQAEQLVEEPAVSVPEPEPPSVTPREEPPSQAIEGMPAKVHTVKRGDTLWDLAEMYYGKAAYWPLIFRANQPLLRNPDLLMVGIGIIIPMLEGTPQALTKEDSTNLAKGYEQAYQAYQRLGKPDAEEYLRSARWYE